MQNNYLKFLSKYQLMGSTAIITDNKQIVKHLVSGFQNREANILTNQNTIYKVASISKVIVALSIMKLIEESKINIDEDISVYLGFKLRNPYFLDKIITTKMIMTQTSSLRDCGDGIKGYYGSATGTKYVPLEDILINQKSIYYDKNVWSENQPGEKFEYCNLGCGILVCIVEKITKQFFSDYISKLIFNPLNINAGFKLGELEMLNNLAVHYEYDHKIREYKIYADQKQFLKSQSNIFPLGDNYCGFAGGLYINGNDLAKIMMMLMNKGTYNNIKLFEQSTIELMMQTHWCGEYDNIYTKKGLQLIIIDKYTENPLFGHFGNAYGLRAFMLFNAEKGIIFIANGGEYLSDNDHLTPLLEEMIKYLVIN